MLFCRINSLGTLVTISALQIWYVEKGAGLPGSDAGCRGKEKKLTTFSGQDTLYRCYTDVVDTWWNRPSAVTL